MPTIPTVTVSGPALAPLRSALYSQLGIHADALALAAGQPDREATDIAASSYRRLAQTAQLLDRVAWIAPPTEGAVELQAPDEATLALQALLIEREIERSIGAEARTHRHTETEHAARSRVLLISATCTQLLTATRAAAAGE
jgi:hypothetical protein